MTEDTSPENLRKFLESDDPALVRMGIAMAKGVSVEITAEDLKHFLKSDEIETVKTGVMLAEEAGIGDEAMEILYEALGDYDGDVNVRSAAAEALGEIGDARAVEPLIEALNEGGDISESAAEALGKIGDKRAVEPLIEAEYIAVDWDNVVSALHSIGEPAIEPLIDLLGERSILAACVLGEIGDPRAVEPLIWALEGRSERGKDWEFTTEVADALGNIGDTRAVEPLIEALGDNCDELRGQAAEALQNFGNVPLIKALGDEDRGIRKCVAGLLDELGWKPETDGQRTAYLMAVEDWKSLVELGEPAIEPLIGVLSDSDEGVRTNAVEALRDIGQPAVEPLIRVLSDDNKWVRASAVVVLGWIGGTRAVEPLIKALEDEDRGVRETAVHALGEIGDVRAVEPLIKMLDLPGIHGEAVDAMGKIGGVRIIELLIGMLSDEDWDVRKSAVRALNNLLWVPETDEQRAAYLIAVQDWELLVEWGEPAVEPLIEALSNENFDVCQNAAEALGKIGDERAVEPLIEAFRISPAMSSGVVTALGKIGKPAVEPLIEALQDSDIRWSAVTALGKIGKPAVELLIGVLSDNDERVRCTAAEMLGGIGDTRAVEPLIKALGDISDELRRLAAGALGAIGDERAVKPLIKALGEGNSYAAGALGEMGDARAVEPLIKALEDESEKVRVEAASSLGEIRDERAVKPLIKALEDENSNVRRYAVAALDALGWEPDTEQFQLVRLLALSSLRFSELPNEAQEGLVEHCKLLLSHGKILNLAQEEFAKIVKERNNSLETMENPCTAEELIELLAGVSSQTRWIVACGVVEISFYNGATMDKIWRDVHRNRPINLFSRISAYSNLITKADHDEILRGMKGLPPVLVVHIAKRLTNFAINSLKDKEASATVKKNRKMITAIFEDLDLAKIILGKM